LGDYKNYPAPLDEEGQERAWRWQPEQRRRVLELLEALEAGAEVGAVFTIARATVLGDDLGSFRVAAARHGADAVLVVSGREDVERTANLWALSYLALVPVLFAPAQELDARFLAHAELWDVRNEYLYLAAEAEADASQTRPLPFIDRQEATLAAQNEAMKLLGQELQLRVSRLHAGG
jgi:hypothetical protein